MLDDLEKYFENSDEIMYERKEEEVFLENGEVEKAYLYVFVNRNMSIYEPLFIDSGDWRKFVS